MSLDCPNGCESMPQSCPIEVDTDTFATKKAEEFENHTGVSTATGSVTDMGNPCLHLEIDQSEFSTENHFKHRDTFEENAIVTDVNTGEVKVELIQTRPVITVMECTECDTVFDADTSEVFSDPNQLY